MGNSTSGQTVHQALKDLLKVKGIRLKKETLENFLKAVDQVPPWFSVSGHLTGPSWEKLGKDLKFAEEQGVLAKKGCCQCGSYYEIVSRIRKDVERNSKRAMRH